MERRGRSLPDVRVLGGAPETDLPDQSCTAVECNEFHLSEAFAAILHFLGEPEPHYSVKQNSPPVKIPCGELYCLLEQLAQFLQKTPSPPHSFLYHYLRLTKASAVNGSINGDAQRQEAPPRCLISVFTFMFLLNTMAVMVLELDISSLSPVGIVFQKVRPPAILV